MGLAPGTERVSSVRSRPPRDLPRFGGVLLHCGPVFPGLSGRHFAWSWERKKGGPGGRTAPSKWTQGRSALGILRHLLGLLVAEHVGWREATQVSSGFPEGSEASEGPGWELVHPGVTGRVGWGALGAPGLGGKQRAWRAGSAPRRQVQHHRVSSGRAQESERERGRTWCLRLVCSALSNLF